MHSHTICSNTELEILMERIILIDIQDCGSIQGIKAEILV